MHHLPHHLDALSRASCPPIKCEPEMQGHCTEELCNDYLQGDRVAAATLVHAAALVMLNNDTRIQRTSAGVPCNSVTCQAQFRHWGCSEDLCTGIIANNTSIDNDIDNNDMLNVTGDALENWMRDSANETEWIAGRSLLSPWMSPDCLQRCVTPLTNNDMEGSCRAYAQVCREYLQYKVRCFCSFFV
jgi:hypothetical protein